MGTVQHIAFNCVDRLKQERFYTEMLGFRRARVFKAGEPDEFVMLRNGATCIELFGGSSAENRGGEQATGFKHLAFEVDDIEAKAAQLRAAGVDMDEIVDCNALARGLRVLFFRDPEGNILEIMEGWTDETNPPAPPN